MVAPATRMDYLEIGFVSVALLVGAHEIEVAIAAK
jgi:hypothetical protein